MGLSGKSGSNGFTYVMPLPMIVCLGVNDVLFGHKVKDTTPVFPGSMHILFLTVNGIISFSIEPWMFILKLSHRDIPSHTPML